LFKVWELGTLVSKFFDYILNIIGVRFGIADTFSKLFISEFGNMRNNVFWRALSWNFKLGVLHVCKSLRSQYLPLSSC